MCMQKLNVISIVHLRLKMILSSTRPDTGPSVADGWAGAEIRVFTLSNLIATDQRTDKTSYRVACPQLKIRGKDSESSRVDLFDGKMKFYDL